MLKMTKYIVTLLLFTLLLSACGTSKDSETQKDPASEPEQSTEQTDKKAKEETESDQQKDQTDTNENESDATLSTEMTLTYQANGQTKEEKAFLKESDNQPFSIYVLPDFDLRAVEPHNDEIYLKNDDSIFMRINILAKDADMKELIENTKAELQAVNEKIETLEPPVDKIFENATVMKASIDGEVVTKYLFELPKSIVKLTLFTKEGSDYQDAMLQMAKTMKTEEVQE